MHSQCFKFNRNVTQGHLAKEEQNVLVICLGFCFVCLIYRELSIKHHLSLSVDRQLDRYFTGIWEGKEGKAVLCSVSCLWKVLQKMKVIPLGPDILAQHTTNLYHTANLMNHHLFPMLQKPAQASQRFLCTTLFFHRFNTVKNISPVLQIPEPRDMARAITVFTDNCLCTNIRMLRMLFYPARNLLPVL